MQLIPTPIQLENEAGGYISFHYSPYELIYGYGSLSCLVKLSLLRKEILRLDLRVYTFNEPPQLELLRCSHLILKKKN